MQCRLKALVAAVTVLAVSLAGLPYGFAEGIPSGVIEGKVVAAEGTPVPGAIVMARNVAEKTEHESAPAGADGSYRLAALPAGRYDVAVRNGERIYLGARSVGVSALGAQSYSFRIEDRPKEEIVSYAEQEGESEGEEGEQGEHKRGGGTPWWDNPLVVVAAGLAFVVGTGALIDAVDDDDDDEDNDGSQSGP